MGFRSTRAAAEHATTYYGQLARAKLGKTDIPLRAPAAIAVGAERAEVVRVVELLEALGETDLARPLAIDAARTLGDEAQIAALAEVVAKAGDARTTLLVGKTATSRGFCSRYVGISDLRRSGFRSDRQIGRGADRLCHRTAGKRLRHRCRIERGRHGIDADDRLDSAPHGGPPPACPSTNRSS